MLQNRKTQKLISKIVQSPVINSAMAWPDTAPSLIAVDGSAGMKQ